MITTPLVDVSRERTRSSQLAFHTFMIVVPAVAHVFLLMIYSSKVVTKSNIFFYVTVFMLVSYKT